MRVSCGKRVAGDHSRRQNRLTFGAFAEPATLCAVPALRLLRHFRSGHPPAVKLTRSSALDPTRTSGTKNKLVSLTYFQRRMPAYIASAIVRNAAPCSPFGLYGGASAGLSPRSKLCVVAHLMVSQNGEGASGFILRCSIYLAQSNAGAAHPRLCLRKAENLTCRFEDVERLQMPDIVLRWSRTYSPSTISTTSVWYRLPVGPDTPPAFSPAEAKTRPCQQESS